MASSLLQDSRPSPPPDAPHDHRSAAFRPYASTKHTVTRARYITSNDPRGYLPVYEYAVNGQWLMVDADNGYVLWTGIWKALGNSKADVVKLLDAQPDLAPQLRRVRGGYLKIQGTWINYEIALRLARRVAWPIRDDLVPIFGPTFPSTCLAPDQPGYGHLTGAPTRRRARRPRPAHSPSPSTHTHTLALAPSASSSSSSSPHVPPPRTPPPPHRYSPYPTPLPLPHPHAHPPAFTLPPLSALTRAVPPITDVLRRLRCDDDDDNYHYHPPLPLPQHQLQLQHQHQHQYARPDYTHREPSPARQG